MVALPSEAPKLLLNPSAFVTVMLDEKVVMFGCKAAAVMAAVIALFWVSQQIWKRRLAKIGSLTLLRAKLMPSYRPAENTIRLLFLILILICLFRCFPFTFALPF